MKRIYSAILLTSALVLMAGSLIAAEQRSDDRLILLSGGGDGLDGWQEKSFEGNTLYSPVRGNEGGVRAESSGTASGLFLEREINIAEYPVLHWSWKIEEGLDAHDERVKAGDDYAARVYVVVSGGLFFWKTIAINYVWSSNPKSEQSWPNAYAGDNAKMLALRGSDDQQGIWYVETRNLRRDFKELFGKDIDVIDGVAIMSDTDDTGGRVVAEYGEIFLAKE